MVVIAVSLAGETALGSPPFGTHSAHLQTHTVFPCVLESPGRPALFLRFLPWPPEPQVPATGSPGWRGFVPHRPKPDHTYRSPLFPFCFVCFVPPTYHTHTCTRFLFLSCYYDCPVPDYVHFRLRLFDYHFSGSWCTRTWNPAPDFLEFTLFCFLDNLGIQ